jgi:hypothetical protein
MKKTSPLLVALAYVVVAVPLAWGLYRSIKNSKPLFTSPPAAAAPAPVASPAR